MVLVRMCAHTLDSAQQWGCGLWRSCAYNCSKQRQAFPPKWPEQFIPHQGGMKVPVNHVFDNSEYCSSQMLEGARLVSRCQTNPDWVELVHEHRKVGPLGCPLPDNFRDSPEDAYMSIDLSWLSTWPTSSSRPFVHSSQVTSHPGPSTFWFCPNSKSIWWLRLSPCPSSSKGPTTPLDQYWRTSFPPFPSILQALN